MMHVDIIVFSRSYKAVINAMKKLAVDTQSCVVATGGIQL